MVTVVENGRVCLRFFFYRVMCKVPVVAEVAMGVFRRRSFSEVLKDQFGYFQGIVIF